MRRAPVLVVLALAAACGSGSHTSSHGTSAPKTGSTASAATTAADAVFAAEMVPHHEQALVMAQAVLDRGASPELKALAKRIKDAQTPEITRLKAVLSALGSEAGHGGGHGSGHGMMSDDDLAALSSASGEELDALFLELMVTHHEGAVEMADAELRDGTYAEARSLAQQIKAAQTREIAEMKALLSRLNG